MAAPPTGERRCSIRQKLHTPVYASFNGPQTGMVVDLSELLDLNEQGFAVQTSQRLEVNRAVTVCLDLPETKNYIHCTGQVIWSDDAGRGGIRFSALSDKSRQALKEWLFANLMLGSANHSARSQQIAERATGKAAEAAPPGPRIVPLSEGSATLAAVEAVRLVIREIGDDCDAILQLITERALSFTGASGAALALLTDGKMICRARAGELAPPLGTPVDVTQGLSGECIRSGILVSCEDTEQDPRADSEVCRALGIASLMAAPIVSNLETTGLLEIFSPYRRRFMKIHGTVLERLIDLIPKSTPMPVSEPTRMPTPAPEFGEKNAYKATDSPMRPEADSLGSQSPAFEERSTESATLRAGHEAFSEPAADQELAARNFPANSIFDPAQLAELAPTAPSRLLYRVLLGLAIVAVFLVVGYLLAPSIDKRWAVSSQAAQRSPNTAGNNAGAIVGSDPSAESASAVPRPNEPNGQMYYLADLRKQAEQGNAEAQWQLGAHYHNGEGVPQDDVQAMQWFQRAADQGHVLAQATLGAYYWAGRGVPQDLTKAYFWSALAFSQGDENSKSRLEGLALQMTNEQLSSARQQAADWIRSHKPRAISTTN